MLFHKKFGIIFCLVLSLLVLPLRVFSQENLRQGEVVTLGKSEVINKDYFAAGESVNLSGTVNGDAYLVGGNITVDGTVNGDLIVAGGDINILGTVNGNVRMAGGSIVTSGHVTRNFTVLGGNVNFTPEARLDGSLVGGVGKVSLNAPVGKGVTLGAGQVVVNNSVGGDINAGVGEFNLNPNAHVQGNITYWSQNNLQVAPEASVAGQTVHNFPPQSNRAEEVEEGARAIGSFFKFISFVSTLLIGLLFLRFFPIFSQKVVDQINNRPWYTLLMGLLSFVIVPILFLVLLITVLGIPIALILLVGFLIATYISKVFVSLLIGQKVLGLLNQKSSIYWAYVLGLLLFYILSLVPVLGGLITGIIMLMGLGAFLIQKKEEYRDLRSKKII